jgi:hypothetical protein
MTIESTETKSEVVCEAVGCQSKANIEVHLKVGAKRILPLFFAIIANENSSLPVIMSRLGGNSLE